jgi:hypothetical protein
MTTNGGPFALNSKLFTLFTCTSIIGDHIFKHTVSFFFKVSFQFQTVFVSPEASEKVV